MLTKNKGGVAFIPTIVSFLCVIGVWLWSPAFLLLLPPVAPPGTQTKKPLSLKWKIQLLGPGWPVNDKYRLDFSDPSVANATTVLVMSDSRSPEESGYHGLSFRINAEYATMHNDTYLVFVHTPCLDEDVPSTESKVCVACVHKDHGARASPWCKLPALMAVMEAYPTAARFIYIDSDAFVNMKAPLPMEYFSSTLNMFYNYPFERSSPACSGIMFWNAGTDAKRILEEWWDTPGLNMVHDFEQSALRSPFWKRNSASIQVIREKTLVSEPGQTFQHIGHDRGDKRESLMQETLRTYLDEGRNEGE